MCAYKYAHIYTHVCMSICEVLSKFIPYDFSSAFSSDDSTLFLTLTMLEKYDYLIILEKKSFSLFVIEFPCCCIVVYVMTNICFQDTITKEIVCLSSYQTKYSLYAYQHRKFYICYILLLD
jgi:hypothetical protein